MRRPGWSAYASYSYLDATYQFTGTLASPNNPAANARGNVTVTPGRRMPLNPASTARAGGDVDVLDGISLGGELAFTGSQYFDGDPSNLNAKLPSTVVVNLRAAWQFDDRWQLFGLVDNLFDNRDALYGSYFDPRQHGGPGDPGPDRSAHPDPAPAGELPDGRQIEVLAISLTPASLASQSLYGRHAAPHRHQAAAGPSARGAESRHPEEAEAAGRGAGGLAGVQARP